MGGIVGQELLTACLFLTKWYNSSNGARERKVHGTAHVMDLDLVFTGILFSACVNTDNSNGGNQMKDGMDGTAWIIGFALIALVATQAGATNCNQAGNELSNCDFTTDLSDWSLVNGDFFRHEPADGATAPGCVEANAVFDGANYHVSIRSTCVPVTGGATYQTGFSAKRQTGQNEVTCYARPTYFSDVDCNTFVAFEFAPSFETDSTWQDTFETHVAPATAASAIFFMICSDSSDYEIRIDDALFGQGLVPVELMSFTVE